MFYSFSCLFITLLYIAYGQDQVTESLPDQETESLPESLSPPQNVKASFNGKNISLCWETSSQNPIPAKYILKYQFENGNWTQAGWKNVSKKEVINDCYQITEQFLPGNYTFMVASVADDGTKSTWTSSEHVFQIEAIKKPIVRSIGFRFAQATITWDRKYNDKEINHFSLIRVRIDECVEKLIANLNENQFVDKNVSHNLYKYKVRIHLNNGREFDSEYSKLVNPYSMDIEDTPKCILTDSFV